jgi:solute carrier family 25 phosphate transporter 23/24/25/41
MLLVALVATAAGAAAAPSHAPADAALLTWPFAAAAVQREGLRGLYSGILPEYYKVVPGVAIAFCTYEMMKTVLGVQINATQR